MKVAIYRTSAEATNECAAALLGTEDWAVDELLHATGIESSRSYSRDEDQEPRKGPWRSVAFDAEVIPGVGKPRIASEEEGFPGHSMGAIVVQFFEWNTTATLSELLGEGWWRFLMPEGEAHYLENHDADATIRSPRLQLERQGGIVFLAGAGMGPIWNTARHEGRLQVVDPSNNEAQSAVFFIPDAKIEMLACQLLQTLREQLRVVGVGLKRGVDKEAGTLRVALLLLDHDPVETDPLPEEPDDTQF